MKVVGIGCRKGVATADVLALIDAVLAERGLSRNCLDALATVPLKWNERALVEAAGRLGLPLRIPTAAQMDAAMVNTLTCSAASLAATGMPSASEVAALAAAGSNARLLAARRIGGGITCAIAVSEDVP